MSNWDLKPERILMNPRDYRDLVVYSLCLEGWREDDATKEADRRMEVMSKDQETHLKEAVEALSSVDFSEGGKTYAGTLLRSTFEGTFPPFCSPSYREEFFASDERPDPLIRAYHLGVLSQGEGLTPTDQAEWADLQETYP
jgi:hypothetical protein